ncbi:hypothetical protein F4677DRAFT_369517 [Hypoxylon crocopeplum]|nr:hypothetical protein F4677DRAFT_369517 [Hypoxylon crocopeplum]
MMRHIVPRRAEVVCGAIVNIVLKEDQRTGREVSGTVRDVLTRGDHHRGIKVRLTDGRIGRVQSIASSLPASVSASPSSFGVVGSESIPTVPADESANLINETVSHPRGRHPRYRDTRLEEPLEVAPKQTNLSTYIVPAKQRKGKNRNNPNESGQPGGSARSDGVSSNNDINSAGDVTSATATCPVCGAFEGDETAVAHHVAGHFE